MSGHGNLHVQLVSPERILWDGEAVLVRARSIEGGDFAILPGHAPFLGALEIDVVKIRTPDHEDEIAAVHGGFISVTDNRVTILSDIAELESQIDIDRAEGRIKKAEQDLAHADDAEVEAKMRRDYARLKAVGKSMP